MAMTISLMASHGYPPGLVLRQELSFKGCQPFLPSPVAKPEIIRYQCHSLRLNSGDESWKSQIKGFNSNHLVNFDFAVQEPMIIGAQATRPNAVFFGFGIVGQCIRLDKILHFLMCGTAEAELGRIQISSLCEMSSQFLGIGIPQQPFLPSLIYPNSKFDVQKPVLDFIEDSALRSKVIIHPNGLVTFMGTETEMKYLLSLVAESYLSKNSLKGETLSLLVPQFSRQLNIHVAEAKNHSSTLKVQSTVTGPLRSPEKVKVRPSPKKNKKAGRERDLYKRNYLHACEGLLSLIVDEKQRQKTAIHSLKKSGPELPELLTQFSAGIAGTGLAVLLSVICTVACGRVPFCASKLLNTGFGFGLVWLSWAVNKLRDTIVGINKNAGKLALKDEEMIHTLDKSIKEIYFRAAALLAVAVLRLA
ncbi:hypothetical protein L6164_010133 [Bauhinia variegata]|uniref:Uncharacterized protein n=1 Tax=Bauhinia variegata TaxID=167791 RepID=A0ACB9PM55_BAUVA|nr:hypothetical protein L6164_010133 [Bauhinia variegata]